MFIKTKQQKLHHEKVHMDRINQNKILVVGGYGYQNVGDEAQLSEVISRLNRNFPEMSVKILSPNVNYTQSAHNYYNVAEAPRVAFFNIDESPIYYVDLFDKERGTKYNVRNAVIRMWFLLRSNLLLWNAKRIRDGKNTKWISAAASGLLYDICTSKLLYFEGGGYLTGKTLSRLWDGILMCKISNIFGVPIVMSGQTIGVWSDNFNKKYAYSGFKHVNLITLRDPKASIEALEEIGLKDKKNIYAVCDDALFCSREKNSEKIKQTAQNSDFYDSYTNGYVSMNFHYWGLRNREDKDEILKKINKIICYMTENSGGEYIDFLFIPMHPSDEVAMNDYINKYGQEHTKILKYNYDFKTARAFIGDSKICVTMKHHPIIFAAGECVPVISLNLSDYYEHKNSGALQILNIEEFFASFSDDNWFDKFKDLLCKCQDRDAVAKQIEERLLILRKREEQFELDLRNVVYKTERSSRT